jgi:hypothetical protein
VVATGAAGQVVADARGEGWMSIAVDNRQVVLLKSLRTNNRFYTLVPPDSGYRNAGAIDEFPPELPLGIAYPCLEDGLNDFAVIRTTFETIEMFADDVELRDEMMGIINDARTNLVLRLEELRDRLADAQAHFLGTDLNEFKGHVIHLAEKGAIRRTLDNMMKLDVFESVSETEEARGEQSEPLYRYPFLPAHSLAQIRPLPARPFVCRLFQDVLDAVNDDSNYENKYTFDNHVFQKFIAVMFVNYATTDPVFYGTSRDDYGVSIDKSMGETPLYQAVARELRYLERLSPEEIESSPALYRDLPSRGAAALAPAGPGTEESALEIRDAGHVVEIPFGAERRLMESLTALAEALRLLKRLEQPRAQEVHQMARGAGQELFRELQQMNVISPLASDPLDDFLLD